MSLVQELHEARKQRLARIASKAIGNRQPEPEQGPEQGPEQEAVMADEPESQGPVPHDVVTAMHAVEEWVERQKKLFERLHVPTSGVSVERIQSAVCEHYGLTRNDLLSQRRNPNVSFPRMVGIHLARRLTTKSYPEIARRFGGRDHTTALHADRKITRLLQTEVSLQASVEMLIDQLGGENK